MTPLVALFAFMSVVEAAHIVSPMTLAWSHPGLRRIALSRPIETLFLPVVGFVAMTALPFGWAGWLRYAGHVWHFGSQHYGVLRIWGWRVNRWFCIVPTAALMISVFFVHAAWWQWFIWIGIDFQHWAVDLGLSGRVVRRRCLFSIVVFACGSVFLYWKLIQPYHVAIVPLMIRVRWGMDIIHYLYSRWIWKLSDPQVRATIGRDLGVIVKKA